MATKLEIAKQTKSRVSEPDLEDLEVVLAYLRGEITVRQAASVMNLGSAGSMTHRVCTVMHWAVENKHIKIELL